MNLNAERLEALIKRIEKLPEPDMAPEDRDAYDFDMRVFTFNDRSDKECNSPACVAGHACFEAYRRGDIKVDPAYEDLEWTVVAGKWLGANMKNEDEFHRMERLFRIEACDFNGINDEITPEWTVACLRKLKDTGEVDWVGTRPVRRNAEHVDKA